MHEHNPALFYTSSRHVGETQLYTATTLPLLGLKLLQHLSDLPVALNSCRFIIPCYP